MSGDKKTSRKPVRGGLPAQGPGRPKGTPNKLTAEVKTILQSAFEGAGGVDRLIKWAKKSDDNYKEFLKIWVKLLPVQLKVDTGDDLAARLAELEAARRRANLEMVQVIDLVPDKTGESD